MEFPVFKTKVEGVGKKFDLSDPKEREKYFLDKAGNEIEKLRSFLKNGGTFIAYLLGKKNSGKGTYSKMFGEVIGKNYVKHISIGDMIRGVEKEIEDENKKEELKKYLRTHYRGFMPVEEALKAFFGRDTKTLLPTEFILTLVKREIDKSEKKTLFIDGFPRGLDQISYSMFFRDLAGYRYDPDIFVLISVPETVIDERIKWRLICPKCNTPRNLKLLPVKEENIRYDEDKKEFFFICDNPECERVRMRGKEGDELGVEPIRERLKLDEELMKKAFSLHGMPKVLLRNTVPVDIAGEYVNDYELTPEYNYEWDKENNKVKIIEKPWVISDENGVSSYSLMAPPVVVSMIKQLVKVLGL
jgi:adenylate kinase family enzyme